MKRYRKILAIALALLMLLSLSACSMSDLPLLKAAMKLTQLNSVHIQPEGVLGLSIRLPAYGMDMNVDMTAEGEVDYRADPLQFSADLRIHAMDEEMRLLAYGEDRSGNFVLQYSTDGVTWEEKTLGKTSDITAGMDKTSDLSLSDLIALGKNLGDSFSGFSKAGQERVNGQSATRYDAGFSLRKILESKEAREAFFKGMAESLHVDASALAEKVDLSALEDLYISLWLDDADSRLVKMQLDLTDMMHSLVSSGLMDSLLASAGGLEDVEFTADVSAMRLALTLSNFDGVGMISRPSGEGIVGGGDGLDDIAGPADSALQIGSTWLGQVTIANHAGQGILENGDYAIWAVLGSVDGQPYFEIYDAEDADNNEASPVMSYWAEIEGERIVPVIDAEEEDGWLLNIYLDDADEEQLIFALEDGVLSASYFYYDAEEREACDLFFTLAPET